MSWQVSNTTIELVQGDITLQALDAIVNAANSRLAGGGGVDGAIHRAGGPTIMEETRRRYRDGCQTGSAVITTAGNLGCEFVIHAVGPIWQGGDSNESLLLNAAYLESLSLAKAHDCDSIAFPALSCGAYGYPIDQAVGIALNAAMTWANRHETRPSLIRFVLFSSDILDAFHKGAQTIFV